MTTAARPPAPLKMADRLTDKVSARVALIRHGEYHQLANTPSALQPYPLTAAGEAEVNAQAQRFGHWLASSGYRLSTEVHCSTSLRAWQTADLYARTLAQLADAPPRLTSAQALCERSLGAVANLSVSEIERIVALDPRFQSLPPGWKSDSRFKLPFEGAESLLDAGQRVADYLAPLMTVSDRGLRLIVGHGASIRHACYHLGILAFDDVARVSMHYGHPIVLERQGGRWTRLYGNWKHRPKAPPLD